MGVKPDHWIRKMAEEQGLIEPFSERKAGNGLISFGLQPAGYDARLDPKILVYDWVLVCGRSFDPLNQDREFFFEQSADPYYDIPPRGFVEAMTVEYFRIPENCVARGMGKTIYSSVGIGLNISGINPGWEGRLRIHIANANSFPIRIYGRQGIIHLEFEEIDGTCERPYGQLEGTRFQHQRDLY